MKKWIALGFAIIAAIMLLLLPDTPSKQYYHHQGNIFGTYYNIRYEGSEDLHEAIKERLQDFDGSLSMFNPNSVISQINRNESVVADSLFERMYVEAYAISELSGGAFDITVAPLVNAWGFGKNGALGTESKKFLSEKSKIDSIKAFVGYEKVRLENHHLHKADERITLDACAIAKGYACDIVANLLRDHECDNLLVDIGGEVVLEGVNDKGEAWRVGITRPTIDATGVEKELQEVIASTDMCMATSGNYLQYYYVDGQRRSHTIDPRTGYPVNHNLLSATVIAPSCMMADAWATAFMVLGKEEALAMCEANPHLDCFLIYEELDGTFATLQSSGFSRWVK